MSTIELPGLYTSIDTSALVQAELEVARQPLHRLQRRESQYNNQQKQLSALEDLVKSLQDTVENIGDTDRLRSASVAVSNESVLSATNKGGATQGSYQVEVGQLATAERQVHAGMASADSLVGAGQFEYTYNGTTRTIYTSADTTLQDLVDLINNDGANPGVSASLLNYEVDPDHKMHLVLSGRETGSDYGITVEAGTTVPGFGAGDFEVTQQARNAQVRVDGYPSTGWIERNSNTLDDVIPGVELSLSSAGTTLVKVERTSEQLEEDLQAFVDAYNAVADKIDSMTGYSDAEGSGVYQGNVAVNAIQQELSRLVAGRAEGFQLGNDAFTMLSDIGVELDRDGKMSLDKSKLDDALSTDYDGVLSLLAANNTGASDSTYLQVDNSLDSTEAGTYELAVNFDGTGNVTSAYIRNAGEVTWREMDVAGNQLTGRDGNPEKGLSITAVWDGVSATQTATVNLRDGMSAALDDSLDTMLDPLDGLFATESAAIKNAVDALEDRMDALQSRIETKEKHLKAKYARMEAMLANMGSMEGAVQSMVASMGSMQAPKSS